MKPVVIQYVGNVKRVISIILFLTSTSYAQDKLDASLSGGYTASFISEESESSYVAELKVDAPVGGFDKLRLRNRLSLWMLPGEGEVENPDTYNSVEWSGQLSTKLGESFVRDGDQSHWTSIYIEAGFGALRKKTENPVTKENPVWMGGGILFEERISRAFFSIGLYADQRLDGLYQPTIGISGGIELPIKKLDEKVKVMFRGDAVIGLVDYGIGAGRQVRVGLMLGI